MRLLSLVFMLLLCQQALAVDITAQTEFARTLNLNSSINARVDKIMVSPGQQVAAGDLLITLVDTGFRAALDIAQAGVDAQIPQVARMQSELDKAQELFDRDSLALKLLQQAEQNYSIALAQLSAAEASLENARFNLSQTRLLAPFAASVVSVDTQQDRYINIAVDDPSLITLVDNRNMMARGLLPAEHWKVGLLNANATITYQNKTYKGRVTEIGQRVLSTNNNHPAVELTVLFQANGEIPANLRVNIHINNN